MRNVKRLWMPLLLGALLIATLVGVAGARPNARPEASPQLVNWMISAHHCIPRDDTTDWDILPQYAECESAACTFYCPIKPPHEGVIRVQRLAMYVFDNTVGNICISLAQVYPKSATYVYRLSSACTGDSAADPWVLSYNPANFKVSVLQDIHVSVALPSNGQRLYGFKLKYEPL
jgi:hypothetical protein